MKHLFKPILLLALMTALTSLSMSVQAKEKMVIALKTSDFELTETDISSLAVGESQTIETGNGTLIDIIKTVDGAEIYVDGELLDMDQPHHGHETTRHVEVTCDDEGNCEEDVIVIADQGAGVSGWVTGEGDQVIIHKETVHACKDDGGSTSCSDPALRVTEESDIDFEELHENEGTHKIIVIEKEIMAEDGSG